MDIDAVITWVDGADAAYRKKLGEFMVNRTERSINYSQRFVSSKELVFCLRSIKTFAPWIRNIYIVTDDQKPQFFNNEKLAESNIKLVSHKEIFQGYERFLPVFNSLAIEAVLWRINGLAERFIYFNDDMFLLKNFKKDFFFSDNLILRGRYTDEFAYKFKNWHQIIINSAKLIGYSPEKFFLQSHVAYPLLRSVFQKLFDDNLLNEENLKFRFRDYSQVWPVALHNHYALNCGLAKVSPAWGCIGLGEFDESWDDKRFLSLWERMSRGNCICINDLQSFVVAKPDFVDQVSKFFGNRMPYEVLEY
jgi:hypothetical protein